MNASPFWPLVWKEYRAGRAFWLAMIGMGLVAQAGVAWLAHQPADRNVWLYRIALMISAGFAVGIGGTLFAVEHEERTFSLLRMLPVRASELGWAKLLCAVIGLLSLWVALWLAAGAMAGWQTLSSRDAGQLWGLWGLASAEGLAWGILCSLAIRSPLRATVAAVLAVTVSVQAAVTLTKTHNLSDLASYTEAIPFRVALLIAVAALDAWLLPRWLSGEFPRAIGWRRASKTSSAAKSLAKWHSPAPTWAAPLGRLMWQTCSEAAGSPWRLVALGLAGVVACGAVTTVLLRGVLDFGQVYVEPTEVSGSRLVPLFALGPFIVMTALAGALTFSLDPLARARFLAERGVSPRLVWLSRQMVWGGWLVGLLAIAAVLTLVPLLIWPPNLTGTYRAGTWEAWTAWNLRSFMNQGFQEHVFSACIHDMALNAWSVWAVLFSTYAVAQLVSLVVRRRLLATVLAIALGGLAARATYLMCELDVPWYWSTLPSGIACLLATWLRAPAWMMGRGSWQSWLAPAAVVVAPLASLAVAVPFYRVDEIPTIAVHWPALNHSPVDAADVKEAIVLYQRASEEARSGMESDEGLEEHCRHVVKLIDDASQQPSVWLAESPKVSWRISGELLVLGHWLLNRAERCLREGQPDQSLDACIAALGVANHVDECRPMLPDRNHQLTPRCQALGSLRAWVGSGGLTAEQIRSAIRRLEECHAARPSPIASLRSWYAAASLIANDLPAALAADLASFSQEQWIASRLPWERERAVKLLNLIASLEVDRTVQVNDRLQADQGIGSDAVLPIFGVEWGTRGVHILSPEWLWPRPHVDDWNRFTQWFRTTWLIEARDIDVTPYAWVLASEETDYRATKIILALAAWKAEHGQLPERLDELVPSQLAALPLDPVYAWPFLYYPHGVAPGSESGAIWASTPDATEATRALDFWFYPIDIDASKKIAVRQTPFLWSALSAKPGEQRVGLHAIEGQQGVFYRVESQPSPYTSRETGVLPAGRAYAIFEIDEEQPEQPSTAP